MTTNDAILTRAKTTTRVNPTGNKADQVNDHTTAKVKQSDTTRAKTAAAQPVRSAAGLTDAGDSTEVVVIIGDERTNVKTVEEPPTRSYVDALKNDTTNDDQTWTILTLE